MANKLDKASQGPTIPLIAVACAVYNLEAQIVGMKELSNEQEAGLPRYTFGVAGALLDLIAALGSLSKFMFGESSSLVHALNKPRFDISRIPALTRWAENLKAQTGNSKLPLLRALSSGAMLLTAGITIWDAERAWRQGDHDAAVAYGVAASGGAAWAMCLLGICINPIILVAGAVLFIVGTMAAGWLVDSDIETLFKNGPFGQNHGSTGLLGEALKDDRFQYLRDASSAYQQLLGVMGKPMIKAERFTEWWRTAPQRIREDLEQIDRQRRSPNPWGECRRPSAQQFEATDWVVTVHSPLFSMFEPEVYKLHAWEEFVVLPHHGVFNVERVERREISEPKLASYRLDGSTLIYVMPKQFSVQHQTAGERFGSTITHRLKVFGQFRLAMNAGRTKALVLPQPSPKTWQPYSAEFDNRPASNTRAGEAPYWLIENLEFKV
ncbi:hypothetical protein HAQ05_26065 [Pseudomonas sp. CA3A]|uniref:Uncharacterized protein n=1 Tax=Pseudomonas typographi TaxID=2715964 RepID=A0ABR7Z9Z7_9PSED|nr:hypothetical protein [Pseudomonas typographi]